MTEQRKHKRVVQAKSVKSKVPSITQRTLFDLFLNNSRQDKQPPQETRLSQVTLAEEPEVQSPEVDTAEQTIETSQTSLPYTTLAEDTSNGSVGLAVKDPRPAPPTKPIHPFFRTYRKLARPDTPAPDDQFSTIKKHGDLSTPHHLGVSLDGESATLGRSYNSPIVLDSSPTQPLSCTNPVSPTLPEKTQIFRIQPSSPLAGRRSWNGTIMYEPPYPDKDSQHVKGPQQDYVAKPCRFEILNPLDTAWPVECRGSISFLAPCDDISHYGKSSSIRKLFLNPEDRVQYSDTLGEEYRRRHPAIGRFVATPPSQSSARMLWTDKWKPTQADQVLGNEDSALYLRNWLRALELQFTSKDSANLSNAHKHGLRNTKRPRIIRAADKKRKKHRINDDDDEFDWIEYSDEEEELLSDDEILVAALYRIDAPSVASSPIKSHTFGSYLTNTIVLVGPPGCGKTAAVYACAEELGWEVFEVYPGIGKRSGVNLNHLVGDVGKNHLVRKVQPRGTDRPGAGAMYFEKRNDSVNSEAHAPPAAFGFMVTSDLQDEQSSESSRIRQSVILLEEVDILFRADVNFWPTITQLIKDCRRPVICTCNDVSLVPITDLPLQTILEFKPPETDVAVSYLQSLCCAEGHPADRQSLAELYTATYRIEDVDVPDSPVLPAHANFPTSDLRRSINTLQLHYSGHGEPPRSADWLPYESLEDLMDLDYSLMHNAKGDSPQPSQVNGFYAELLSFMDSHLLRHPIDTLETALWDSTRVSPDDDEMSYAILANPSRASHILGGFGMNDHDTLIAETAIRLARGGLMDSQARGGTIVMFRPRELFRARVEYQSQLRPVLGSIMPSAAPLMPRPVVFTDYLPWIRAIVAADDEHVLHLTRQGRRNTRNSRNSCYGRMIDLCDDELDILRKSRIGVCLM